MVDISSRSGRAKHAEVDNIEKSNFRLTLLPRHVILDLIKYLKSPIKKLGSKNRRLVLLSIDMSLVLISPFAASFIRENFVADWQKLLGLVPHSIIGIVVAALCFLIAGTHRSIWRHVSLRDFTRIMSVNTVIILVTSVVGFVVYRLEGVPRSLPLIQLAIIISSMSAIRLGVRWRHSRRKQQTDTGAGMHKDHVLIIGMNRVAELYLRCVADLAMDTISVAGILDEDPELDGRLLHHYKVLGQPVELPQILAQYNVHGIEIKHVVVATKFNMLSEESKRTLLRWERSGTVKLDLFEERLGFGTSSIQGEGDSKENILKKVELSGKTAQGIEPKLGIYAAYVKRTIDIIGAIVLLVVLSPLMLLISLTVATNLGLPLIFWQQRPGRYGVPFKLYKFRTMKPGHDNLGNIIPDEKRETLVGRLLRRTRMDEIPQLYNVITGEMSFVGPRPLLPVDIPQEMPDLISLRNFIRPGLTGWAQVHGGKHVVKKDKMRLDAWYAQNLYFWVDFKIIFLTLIVVIRGDVIDFEKLNNHLSDLDETQQEDNSGNNLDDVRRVTSG